MDTRGWNEGRWALAVAAALLLACGGGGGGGSDDDGGEDTDASAGTDSGPTSPTATVADGSSGGSDATTGGEEDPVQVELLTTTEHLVRVSMALRGTRPSIEDLEAVEADPAAIDGIVDQYLQSPRFGATMMNLHNEALLVEPDYAYYPAGFPNVGPLEGRDFYEINRDIMQAPLRLVEHVIMNDLPYSEVVTGDYTLANDTVAAVWGLPYDGSGQWEVTAWSDGRDNAGVLSDSWLFQRHRSTDANANRGRANLVATAFLCADFTSNDVDVDVSVDLSDPEEVADAVLENPSCATCHVQLDPLASYFRGFFPIYVPEEIVDEQEPPYYPMELPWYEEFFPELLEVPMLPPSYYGEQGDGLAFLGSKIAEDPRFSACTVRRFWSYLHQSPLQDVPDDTLDALDADFAASMDAKALVKSIVLHDDFKVARVVPENEAAPTDAELEVAERLGMLKARPEALGAMMEDLTGFDWVTNLSDIEDEETGESVNLGRVPLLQDSFLGYRVLGGGIDSTFVTQSAHTYSGPNLLLLTALARETAHYVVEHDADASAGDRALFTQSPEDTQEAVVRAQLSLFHRRVYAQEVAEDDVAIDDLYGLFEDALAVTADPRRAWKAVLTAMLTDLRVAFY